MKYGKSHTDKLIAWLLPMLKPITTPQRVTVPRKGHELIAAGIYTTETGKGISRALTYQVKETINVEISHKKKLEALIRGAKTPEHMTTLLASYLRNYGYSPDELNALNKTKK